MNTEWFGYVAAICTTIAFIPQVIRVIKTRDTNAISLSMYSLFTFGIAMWLIYGVLLKNIPMMLANLITFVLALIILGCKIRDVRFKQD